MHRHTTRIRILRGVLGLTAGLLLQLGTAHALVPESRSISVPIRDDVTVRVSLDVYESSDENCAGISALAVHGLAHTGTTFGPFADYLFGGGASSNLPICKLYSLSLPAHGESGIPRPTHRLLAGDLALGDYATALIEVIERLELADGPSLIIAHSMGGMVVQMAQERLLSENRSFGDLGVSDVLLLAPAFPSPVPWLAADSGALAQLAAQFIVQDPVRGTIAVIPADVWIGLFFLNLSGIPAPGTPAPEEAQANGYISSEPFVAAGQLIGLFGPRPFVQSDAFAAENGTQMAHIAYEQDGLSIFPSEHLALYQYLTGDSSNAGFFPLTGSETVHDSYIANPGHMEPALTYLLSQ